MNILFLTMGSFESIEAHSLYTDLLRCFRDHRHDIYVINPAEGGKETNVDVNKGVHIVHVKTGDVRSSSNLIKKGIAQIEVGSIYIRAIKKYYNKVHFDLILYSTPPITLVSAIEYVKKRDNARTYLLLKDIFPQNAVDIGMMTKTGIKGMLYKYFRQKEKQLYRMSDHIGCMSQANVDYVIKHNPEIDPKIVEVCPNAIEVLDKSVDAEERDAIRGKYGIPLNKKVFVYGGNLGKPQGIPFIVECLQKCSDMAEVFFLIIGGGTEYGVLEQYANNSGQKNLKLMKSLPRDDYDSMVGACDVGMIFLDHRFTIPNFPSRLLSYMQAKVPVLACTDPNTDIGKIITEGGFGLWCESDNSEAFKQIIMKVLNIDTETISSMKAAEWKYLCDNYSSDTVYRTIVKD